MKLKITYSLYIFFLISLIIGCNQEVQISDLNVKINEDSLEIFLLNGKKYDGLAYQKNESNKFNLYAHFKEGKKDSIWLYKNNEGVLLKIEDWTNGKLNTLTHFSTNGDTIYLANFSNGTLTTDKWYDLTKTNLVDCKIIDFKKLTSSQYEVQIKTKKGNKYWTKLETNQQAETYDRIKHFSQDFLNIDSSLNYLIKNKFWVELMYPSNESLYKINVTDNGDSVLASIIGIEIYSEDKQKLFENENSFHGNYVCAELERFSYIISITLKPDGTYEKCFSDFYRDGDWNCAKTSGRYKQITSKNQREYGGRMSLHGKETIYGLTKFDGSPDGIFYYNLKGSTKVCTYNYLMITTYGFKYPAPYQSKSTNWYGQNIISRVRKMYGN